MLMKQNPLAVFAGLSLLIGQTDAQEAKKPEAPKAATGYADTPFLPGGKWRVHDDNRPRPGVVTPGKTAADAPSDAIVLFDGKNLDEWVMDKDNSPANS
jgi:hypothetical protein